ncbi:EKC/KEOPS complex subunit Tprkb-like [Eurytemora carolleeae]|uniref:EKC/KEOPS complex subunit Tprkb-like n=1 Tax=Eurytemora carolleeae TaxID=1294199 RepID=UPI000C7859D2|nr:EKC/KEOPS complex subunit Tprkb-like [Eurytemora carolleeae]|eukprot:XP_023327598.1 EKC/KEOPS complex subunit Tprkb-like [Eurytemora affinis]
MDYKAELTSTGGYISIGYAENVENTAEVRSAVLNGRLNSTVLRGCLIPDPLLITVAGNKVALAEQRNNLRTRSIHTELLYSLSSTNNISQSLKNFGAAETDTCLIICSFNTDLSQAREIVKGTWKPLSALREKVDMETLIKIHKLKPEETGDNLISSLISRVAAKDTL